MAKEATAKKQFTFQDYLPKRGEKEETIVFSVRVPKSLLEKADEKRKVDNHKWVEIVQALLKAYVGGTK